MQKLSVTLIQTPLVWENPEANRRFFSEKINTLTKHTDLIVLPEMFTTGFTMNASQNAETMEGETLKWMRKTAKEKNAAITGSLIIKETENYYNRLLFVFPDGKTEIYDKRHLFTLAGEDKIYTAGNSKLTVDFHGWKICPLICYDLRFPVWARNVENYDVLLYVANWPKVRIAAWDALLKARAVENMAYCIGVNRTGTDGPSTSSGRAGVEYNGHSAVYDALGENISGGLQEQESAIHVTLEKNHIEEVRQKLKFLDDRDEFNISM